MSIGLKEIEDAIAGDPTGLAAWAENFYEERRQQAGVAYGLEGVRAVTEALVRMVLIVAVEGETVATGVELVDGGRFMARKGIIICCGALRMPRVLMLSGISSTEQLEQIGVKQLVKRAQVLRSLLNGLTFETPQARKRSLS